MVWFSNGANELIDQDRSIDSETDNDEPACVEPDPDWDGEGAPFTVENPGWDVVSIGRVDRDGESEFVLEDASVSWVTVEDASHLDPPKGLPPDCPEPYGEHG